MFTKNHVRVVALATLLYHSHAFWRMPCLEMAFGRIDPVVQPGIVSGHVHTVVGGDNFGVNATGATLLNSRCTSCVIQDDKSAYWIPTLYYQYPNGSFIDVPHGGAIIYYLGRGNNQTRVPFPPGFRMVVGDAGVRSFDSKTLTWNGERPIAERVSWLCITDPPSPETYGLSGTNCPYGLRAQVQFPTCWNGVDLYKSDQSHVAHLGGIDHGDCPPTHPFQFVHIFQEVYFQPNDVPEQQAGGRFLLSTGDPTGYSLHADFMNGWNQTVLENAIRDCALGEEDGDLRHCPHLLPSYNDNIQQLCPKRPAQVQERVTGLMNKLPGCINVVNGPARAQPTDTSCAATVVRPAVIPTPNTTPVIWKIPKEGQPFGLPNWSYVGCTPDSIGARTLQGSSRVDTTNMTVEGCQQYCASNYFRYAGLEYSQECYCAGSLQDNFVFGTMGQVQNECWMICSGKNDTFCGGSGYIDVYENPNIQPLPIPVAKQVSLKYSHKGCFVDSVVSRPLQGPSVINSSVTPDLCAAFCTENGQRFFGVEYAEECYCGNQLLPTSLAPTRDCSMNCAGNQMQTQYLCGGPARMDIYYTPYRFS